jgi:ABC-type multidrug transport system ATPase subunit
LIGENYKEITFKVRKGEHLGIYSNAGPQVDALFRVLSRQSKSFRGKLNIFGIDAANMDNAADYRSSVLWLNYTYSDQDLKNSIKKMVNAPRKIKKQALEAVFLDYDTSKKLNECSEIELLRIKIANALCLNPGAIAFRIPTEDLGKMETEQIIRIITKIKETYDVILLIHGPKEIIEVCDKILVLKEKEKTEKAGSLEELNEKMPNTGEIILLQLTNPTQDEINSLFLLPDTEVMELRKAEKFKIFSRLNPDTLIIQLFEKFGTKIFNLQRSKMKLGELLELNEFTQINEKEEIIQ